MAGGGLLVLVVGMGRGWKGTGEGGGCVRVSSQSGQCLTGRWGDGWWDSTRDA